MKDKRGIRYHVVTVSSVTENRCYNTAGASNVCIWRDMHVESRFCGVTADVRHETSLTSIPSVRPWKELQNLPISSLRLRSVVMATLSLNHMIHVAYHVPAFPRGLSTPESVLKPSSRTVVITTGIVFLYSFPFPGHLLLEWHLLIIN